MWNLLRGFELTVDELQRVPGCETTETELLVIDIHSVREQMYGSASRPKRKGIIWFWVLFGGFWILSEATHSKYKNIDGRKRM